jgi:hypothetical protein
MTADRLREALQKRPFERFVIHLADGRKVPVDHPELAAIYPSGRTVFVVQRDETSSWIDVLLITELEWKPANHRSKKRSAKN